MSRNDLKRLEQGEFFLIAGPCVVESRDLCLEVAETVARLTEQVHIPFCFKASYRKANRLSAGSFTGIGDDEALKILSEVKRDFDLPILTDVHETAEMAAVAEVYGEELFLHRRLHVVPARHHDHEIRLERRHQNAHVAT